MNNGGRRELAASTAASTALMFVLGKYVANAFGPVGAGYQGGFNSAVTVAASLALFGTTTSVPAYAARFAQQAVELTRRLVRLLAVTVLAATPVLSLLIAPVLHPTFSAGVLAPASFLALLAATATPLSRTMLSVYGSSRDVALQQVIYSAVSVAVTVGLLDAFGLAYLPLSLATGMVAGQTLATVVLRFWSGPTRKILAHGKNQGPPTQALLAYSFPYFVTASCGQLAFAGLPYVVLALAGAEVAGLFRSGLSVSLAAYGVLYTSVLFNLYPRLASAKTRSVVSEHLYSEVRVILKWGSIAAVCIAVSAPLLLWLAFSKEFVVGSACLAFLSVASVPRLLTSVNTMTLMASGKRRGMLVTELSAGLLVMIGASIAAIAKSETAIGFAFLISSLVGLGVAETTTRRLTSHSALLSIRRMPAIGWWSAAAGLIGSFGGLIWAITFGG